MDFRLSDVIEKKDFTSNITIMRPEISKQEIIMVTAAFSRHHFCKRIESSHNHLSQVERLEEACWDGMLEDLLGNIIEKSAEGKRLCLNQVRAGNVILGVELCNYPQAPEHELSIDPRLFLNEMNWN